MSNENFTKQYAPPSPIDSNGNTRYIVNELHTYISNHLTNAKNYLRSNRAWKHADLCMSILYGDERVKVPQGMSRISVKKLRRQAREAIANQFNIRPNLEFRTFKEYEKDAIVWNNLHQDWWISNFIDLVIKEAGQWAGGAGTGWIFEWPEKDNLTGEIEIKARALSHKHVLVSGIGADANYQNAYNVTVRLELPLSEAHERFPNHIDIISKDRDAPSYLTRGFKEAKRLFKGVVDHFRNKQGNTESITAEPTVDIFYTWIRDCSYNKTGKTIQMGKKYSHWGYEVSSYFDEEGNVNQIGTGEFIEIPDPENVNQSKRESITRDITLEECKLYPNRRLVISCSGGIIYDGPPIWGNYIVPVFPVYFEKLPNELLGYPVIMDARSLEVSANNILRCFEDAIQGKLNPPIGIDDKLPEHIAQQMNPRKATNKIIRYAINILSNAVKPLLSEKYYDIDAKAFEILKFIHEMMDYVTGTADFTAWQHLKQMPASDTQESMTQNLGILATDQSRLIEQSLLLEGLIWFSFAPQVYTTRKILSVLGPSNVKLENITYDPNEFVPAKDGDTRPTWQRLRDHAKNFRLYAAPNSMQERQSITNQLKLFQAQKAGVTISDKKIYDALINDGKYEETTEQYYIEQENKAKAATKIALMVEKLKSELNPNPTTNPIADKLNQVLSPNNEGRPPNNTAPPQLQAKTDSDGVPRSTVATS